MVKNVDWQQSELFEVYQLSMQTKAHIGKMIQENARMRAEAKKEAENIDEGDPDAEHGSQPSASKSKKNKESKNDLKKDLKKDSKKEAKKGGRESQLSVKELIERDHTSQKELCDQPRHIFSDLELDYYIGLIKKHASE